MPMGAQLQGRGDTATRWKKHSAAEIEIKLAQAKELAAQGKVQSEIAQVLGVSVMTLHRWRKSPVQSYATSDDQELSQDKRIADIQRENLRLRRLVTDLLLEKMKLEEAAEGYGTPYSRDKLQIQ
jgi:putative transposase